jgi:hypothetical protein
MDIMVGLEIKATQVGGDRLVSLNLLSRSAEMQRQRTRAATQMRMEVIFSLSDDIYEDARVSEDFPRRVSPSKCKRLTLRLTAV